MTKYNSVDAVNDYNVSKGVGLVIGVLFLTIFYTLLFTFLLIFNRKALVETVKEIWEKIDSDQIVDFLVNLFVIVILLKIFDQTIFNHAIANFFHDISVFVSPLIEYIKEVYTEILSDYINPAITYWTEVYNNLLSNSK
jgi:hypothetical protein